MNTRPVDPGKLRGLLDKAFGLGKETVGVLINNDRLQDEGSRQQDKATAALKSLRHEAEAKAEEAKAETLERTERKAQRAKSNA